MKQKPTCHPNKKHAARGLCENCYNKWLRDTNPGYKKRCQESSSKARNKPEGLRARDNSLLKQRYGITLLEKEAIEISQEKKCKICKKIKKLVVEHDHKTGKVRGLTCTKCNTFIGQIENNLTLLPTVLEYLNANPKQE